MNALSVVRYKQSHRLKLTEMVRAFREDAIIVLVEITL
jgi:hypothetical protein